MKYDEHLNNMIVPKTISAIVQIDEEKSSNDLPSAKDVDSPEFSPINPAATSVPISSTETHNSATDNLTTDSSANSADYSLKRPAIEATAELISDGRNKLKRHFDGILNDYEAMAKEKDVAIQKLAIEQQKVQKLEKDLLNIKEKLDAAKAAQNTCVICNKECFKFCGISCMK